ncbi:Retrotransposon protein [Arachis hypogaea]|nr:Retrotransposon protein [Arachis hypogaea]
MEAPPASAPSRRRFEFAQPPLTSVHRDCMLIVVAAAPLAGSSASRVRVWSLSSITLLLGVEFAVDEEALSPGILNKSKLVAIDAGNRGYPPNKSLLSLSHRSLSIFRKVVRQYNKNATELNGLETCTIAGKKNDKAVNEDLLKDEIVSEHLTRVGRLEPSRNMGVEEMVAMFLHIIAHDVNIRVIKRQFVRSEETISRRFNDVLLAILRCHNLLLKKPQPFSQDRMDERWKWFKDCLGALDGTHIKVNVLEADKPRYRNKKGDITTNVLGVVAPDMQFIYVLAGWEGSAADSRVLRDALFRNGFSVPQGHYYLCDAGYMNCEGFLAPYRGQKYHLSEFNPHNQPSTAQEFFNMKHSQARNVIERAFGVLKARWGILRGRSFYPIKTQGRIITACCLLHNHIRRVMVVDPIDEIEDQNILGVDSETIHHIETSDAWGRWRDQLAQEM